MKTFGGQIYNYILVSYNTVGIHLLEKMLLIQLQRNLKIQHKQQRAY